MTTHSPGPWYTCMDVDPVGRAHSTDMSRHQIKIYSGSTDVTLIPAIGDSDRWTPEQIANARLIAAAPALLEALEGLIASNNAMAQAIPAALSGHPDARELHHADVAARESATDAIAAAKGEN